MTKEAEQMLAELLKTVKLNGSFDPEEIGNGIGLTKVQSEAAARQLSNAGILVIGFDSAAQFSPDYRKANRPVEPKAAVKKPGRKKAKHTADVAAV
jgi:hypothetical protein